MKNTKKPVDPRYNDTAIELSHLPSLTRKESIVPQIVRISDLPNKKGERLVPLTRSVESSSSPRHHGSFLDLNKVDPKTPSLPTLSKKFQANAVLQKIKEDHRKAQQEEHNKLHPVTLPRPSSGGKHRA